MWIFLCEKKKKKFKILDDAPRASTCFRSRKNLMVLSFVPHEKLKNSQRAWMNFHRDTFDLYTAYLYRIPIFECRPGRTRPLPLSPLPSSYYIFATRIGSRDPLFFAISPPRFVFFSTFVPKFHPAILPPPQNTPRGLIPLKRGWIGGGGILVK